MVMTGSFFFGGCHTIVYLADLADKEFSEEQYESYDEDEYYDDEYYGGYYSYYRVPWWGSLNWSPGPVSTGSGYSGGVSNSAKSYDNEGSSLRDGDGGRGERGRNTVNTPPPGRNSNSGTGSNSSSGSSSSSGNSGSVKKNDSGNSNSSGSRSSSGDNNNRSNDGGRNNSGRR